MRKDAVYTKNLIKNFKKIIQEYDKKLQNSKLPPILKNRYVVIGIIFFAIAISLISLTSTSNSISEIPTYKVNRDDFLVTITESGEIRAKKSITVSAPRVRGSLKILYLIQEGSIVKPGDELVKFDPSDALNKLEETESSLEIVLSDKKKLIANHISSTAKMESALKTAELSYELSKLNLSQMKFEAHVKQQEAELQHQKNKLSYEQTKQESKSIAIIQQSEMDKMDIEIKQKQNELDAAKKEFGMLVLTAPAEGLVVYAPNWRNQGRKFAVGDEPWRGMGIIELPDLSYMESVTYVNEVDVSKIKKGQKVIVKLDAFRDSSFTGEISSVASIGRNKENDVNIKVFEILVDINESSDILKPGMTTSNQTIINKVENVLFIPQEAVFDRDDEKIVFLKNGSSFDEVEVTLGGKSEDYIIVLDGIEENNEVSLQNPNILEDVNSESQSTSNESIAD